MRERNSKDITGGQGAQTKCVHASEEFNRTRAISSPIWQTTTFRADSSEHFAELARAVQPSEYYSRYGNPTHQQVEAVMTTLEGGEAALVTASGMGAIFTSVMSLLDQGDHDTLTHDQRRAMEVGENLVRISVGLEDEHDLIDDFAQALEQV